MEHFLAYAAQLGVLVDPDSADVARDAVHEILLRYQILPEEVQNNRVLASMPIGDYSDALLELEGLDPNQGELDDWRSLTPYTLFPRDELVAFWRLGEHICPTGFLLAIIQDPQALVIARVDQSSRHARILDRTRCLIAAFILERRRRAHFLMVPEWTCCSLCGLDTTGQCTRCHQPVCRMCRQEFQLCFSCLLGLIWRRRRRAMSMHILS